MRLIGPIGFTNQLPCPPYRWISLFIECLFVVESQEVSEEVFKFLRSEDTCERGHRWRVSLGDFGGRFEDGLGQGSLVLAGGNPLEWRPDELGLGEGMATGTGKLREERLTFNRIAWE